MRKVLFIGAHTDMFQLVADILGVEAIMVDDERTARVYSKSADAVVTGHLHRTNDWFHWLNAQDMPCACFAWHLFDKDEFQNRYPKIPVVEKSFDHSSLDYLRSCLELEPHE